MLTVLRQTAIIVVRAPLLLVIAAAIGLLATFTALTTSALAQADTPSVAAFTALGLAVIAQPFAFHLVLRAWMTYHDKTLRLPTGQVFTAAASDVRIALSALVPIGLLLLIGAVFFGFGLVLTIPWALCVVPVMLLRRCGGRDAISWLRDKLSIDAVISLLIILLVALFCAAAATAAIRPLLHGYAPVIGVAVLWLTIAPTTSMLVLATHQNRRLRPV